MRDARFSRHVAVDGFGAVGQAALQLAAANIAATDDAADIAARFLAAGGVALAARPTALTDPPLGDWWPLGASDHDTLAAAIYRGSVAATTWMLDARERFRAVVDAIAAHARDAYPRECCGYVAGDDVVRCENVAREADAYAFADADLVTFVRTLDSPRPARIVYHSHPNGSAYFSPRDRAVAATPTGPVYPVAHLVVGVDATGPREVAIYAWQANDFAEVARFALPC